MPDIIITQQEIAIPEVMPEVSVISGVEEKVIGTTDWGLTVIDGEGGVVALNVVGTDIVLLDDTQQIVVSGAGVVDVAAGTLVVELDFVQGPTGPTGPQGPVGPSGAGSSSVSFTRTAFTTLSGHRAVTPRTDGTIEYASPATIGNQPVWITTQAAVAGDQITVTAFGDVIESTWSWSPGNVYLAANGVLTQTAPTSGALVAVGEATDPTRLFVDRAITIDL